MAKGSYYMATTYGGLLYSWSYNSPRRICLRDFARQLYAELEERCGESVSWQCKLIRSTYDWVEARAERDDECEEEVKAAICEKLQQEQWCYLTDVVQEAVDAWCAE